MGQNKDSVHGLGEQRQIVGTREVSTKCFHDTHIANHGQPHLSSLQSQEQTKPATAQQELGMVQRTWIGWVTSIYPTKAR